MDIIGFWLKASDDRATWLSLGAVQSITVQGDRAVIKLVSTETIIVDGSAVDELRRNLNRYSLNKFGDMSEPEYELTELEPQDCEDAGEWLPI